MRELAYGKINLFLSVGALRPDGYHDIDTVMHTVGIYDVVDIQKADDIRVFCDCDIPERENLAYRAAQVFFNRTGISAGAGITLEKRIPTQAGMGGGSADAAAVLRGLNKLYSAGLKADELAKLGALLGADVPFCVYGGKCRCGGTGELITPLEREKLHLVIVKPEVSCPTGKMYGMLDTVQREMPEYSCGVYFNSFHDVCPEECLGAINRLKELGADESLLCGSGSAVFGVFETEKKALEVAAILKTEYPFCEYTETV